MHINAALNHRDRAKTQMRDLYSASRHFHHTHEHQMQRRGEILNSLSHCPRWVIAFVQGYADCLYDAQYQHLEFCSLLDDGTIVSHVSSSPRYYQKRNYTPMQISQGIENGLCVSQGFYWIGTDISWISHIYHKQGEVHESG